MTDATIDRPSKPGRLGAAFHPTRNSLNFLRLALALVVIASHAVGLGLFGSDWVRKQTTWATIAVYGFFGISGFLIARSAGRNSLGRFLWQRFLRIAPAFWVCLPVTAFGLGLASWLASGGHHTVVGYFAFHDGPTAYVTRNLFFQERQQTIGGLLWNGSMWTIFFEILCYLVVGVLAAVGALRHREAVLALTVALWADLAFVVCQPRLNGLFNVLHWRDPMNFLTLLPVFMVGVVLWLYRDVVPDSGMVALLSVAVFVAGLWVPLGTPIPVFRLTSATLFAPFLVYPMLWLGLHLPFVRVGARHDYSYGMYLYAFPVQQFLATAWHVNRQGYVVYLALSILGTFPFAAASWWLVERRALALKRVTWSVVRRRVSSPVSRTRSGDDAHDVGSAPVGSGHA